MFTINSVFPTKLFVSPRLGGETWTVLDTHLLGLSASKISCHNVTMVSLNKLMCPMQILF